VFVFEFNHLGFKLMIIIGQSIIKLSKYFIQNTPHSQNFRPTKQEPTLKEVLQVMQVMQVVQVSYNEALTTLNAKCLT